MDIICTSKLHIDNKEFFKGYLSWCEVLHINSSDRASIDRFVDDYFSSMDDVYFHADNAVEIKDALTGILVKEVKEIKNYLIVVGTHPTAGSVFKFFKNYESPCDDSFAI